MSSLISKIRIHYLQKKVLSILLYIYIEILIAYFNSVNEAFLA